MSFRSLVAAIAFFGTCFLANQSQAISLEKLDLYEDLVLVDRLQQIQNRQSELLNSCASSLPTDFRSIPSHQALYRIENFESISARQFLKDHIQIKIKSIRSLIPPIIQCHGLKFSQLDKMMILSPRKNLSLQSVLHGVCLKTLRNADCFQQVQKMLNDLQPHCFESIRTGLANITENHACFAGDKAMDTALSKAFADDKHRQVFIYADVLYKEAQRTQAPQLELAHVFPELLAEEKSADLMALLVALTTSGNSGLTGWIQSLEDRWLIADLVSAKEIPAVMANFKFLQQGKIRYQVARDILEKKKIKLLLKGHDVSHWTRHNFMAAFLGCHFSQMNSNVVINFIKALGIGYESKDFVAHWLEGISMKESVENFRTDTHRYVESGQVGIELCR